MVTENINIRVDDKGSAKVVSRDISKIGDAADKSQSSVDLLTKALIGLGGTVILTGSVATLAQFSQELSTVKAITSATETEFQKLRNTAKELGAETRFSATQAAEAISFLGRAGFNTGQILASVEGTLRLAQAGALDLGSAADIASNILTGFRLNAEETGRVVDVLAAAASSANTNVQQLGAAAKFVAPVAAGLGVSIEEATAAIGALSDAGLQAEMAGTGLRRVLSELESPAAKTQKILAQLGLSTDDVRITSVGLTTALERLTEAGVDTGTALEIFGDRGGPAFEVLSNAIPKVISLTDKLENAGGTAARISQIMDDNLNGALLAVGSAAEAVVLAFGDLGAEDLLTQALRAVADGLRFLAANAEDAAQAVAFLISVLSVTRLYSFISGLEGATLAAKALNLVIAANPIGLLLTALTAATAALIFFQDEIAVTEDGLVSLGDLLSAVWISATEAFDIFITFFRDNFGFVSDIAEEVFGDITFSIEGILSVAATVIDSLIGLWVGYFRLAKALFTEFAGFVAAIFKRISNAIVTTVEDNLNDVIGVVNTIGGALGFGEIAEIEIGRFADTSIKGMGEIGEAASMAFVSGFDISPAQNALDFYIERARSIAEQRAAEGAREDAAGASDVLTGAGAAGALDTARGLVEVNTAFQDYLKSLEDEKSLLRLSSAEREVQRELLMLEKDLKRELTAEEEALAEQSLTQLQALQRQADLLEEIRGPAEEYRLQLEALNELLKTNQITTDEYNNALEDLKGQMQESSEIAGQFGDLAESSFVKAGTALTDFVRNGTADFSGMVVSILEDLQRLTLQLAASSLFGEGGGLGNFFGGGSGAGGAGGLGALFGQLFGGLKGFANGGRPPVGEPIIVGERGRELFVPDTSGTIVPNNDITVQAPSVNLTNKNILDPGIVANFLRTPEGQKELINVIRLNPTEVNQILR